MNKVRQVTGRTTAELKFLERAITRLSVGLGTSSAELTSVARILSQAGFRANDLESALSTLAKTTLAPTFEDITKTAEGAIAIFNQFGKGAAALEQQLGAINAVAGKFAVESADLIGAVRRMGGVFEAAGGSLNELIALFTAVRSTTRESAESIATGLRTIFTRIQRPKTIEFLKEYGVELLDLEGKFVGPFEAVRRLSDALGGLEEGDIRFIRVGEELAGFRQIGKVIPLLQQFEVAERARQEALKGGDSLTKDAATAQETLAIQITKVKQEWLALVRSIAETTTFKTLVKTMLGLASSLAKVLESLKPLLPVMTAFAGIKIARGLGGMLGGLRGGRGLKGILGFARGGVVPGTGNRDSVPAMLTPGEFVIRKSSVSKIGADNLASMNGYATGGRVAKFAKSKPSIKKYYNVGERIKGKGRGRGPVPVHDRYNMPGQPNRIDLQSRDKFRKRAEVIWNAASDVFDKQGLTAANKLIKDKTGRFSQNLGIKELEPGNTDEVRFNKITGGLAEQTVKRKLGAGAKKLKDSRGPDFSLPGGKYAEVKTNKGRVSDNVIIGKAILARGISAKGALKRNNKKDTVSPKIDFYQSKFAKGGSVGTDTVPALLTPGEFVINKKAAGAIGTANLNRMNKSGVSGFAAGGRVGKIQRFAEGGGVGGMGLGGNIVALSMIPGIVESLTTTFDENGEKIKTFTSRLADAFIAMGTTVASVTIAMQAFGVSLSLKGIKDFFGTGSKSFGGLLMSAKGAISTGLSGGSFTTDKRGRESFRIKGAFAKKDEGPVAGIGLDSLSGKQAEFMKGLTNFTNSVRKSAVNFGRSFRKAKIPEALGEMKKGIVTLFPTFSKWGSSLMSGGSVIGTWIKSIKLSRLAIIAETAARWKNKAGQLMDKIPGGRKVRVMGKRMGRGLMTKMGKSSMGRGLGSLVRGGAGLLRGGASMLGLGGGAAAAGGGAAAGGAAGAVAMAQVIPVVGQVVAVMAALAAVTGLVSAGLTAYFDVQYDYEKAVKAGNVALAEKLAVEKEVPGIVQLVNRTFGSLLTVFGAGENVFAEMWVGLWSIFGGDTVKQMQLAGKTAALVAKYDKEKAENAKKASEALKDLAAGSISSSEAAKIVAENFKQAQAIKGSKEAEALEAEAGKSRSMFGDRATDMGLTQRNLFTLGGLVPWTESTGERNKRIDKEAETLREEGGKVEKEAFDALTNAAPQLSKSFILTAGEGADAADFLKSFGDDVKFSDDQVQALTKVYKQQQKAVEENIRFLKSMNFGLRSVRGQADSVAASMDNIIEANSSGATSYSMAMRTLDAAMGEGGSIYAPGGAKEDELKGAKDAMASALSDYGATPEQQQNVSATIDVATGAQAAMPEVLKRLQQDKSLVGGGVSADKIQEAFRRETKNVLKEKFVPPVGPARPGTDAAINDIVDNISAELTSDQINMARKSGNLEAFTDATNKSTEAMGEKFNPILALRNEAEKKLMDLANKRIAIEQQLITTQRQAADISLEAAKARESFGGKKVTAADRAANVTSKLNLSLGGAGVRGLSGASASDFRSAQGRLSERFNNMQGMQGSFRNLEGREADERPQAVRAQKDLIAASRARIAQIHEEIKIIAQKNALEKSSIEKLMSGDIQGFFKDQGAAGAASAIRTGGSVQAFSAEERMAGIQSLKTELSPEEFERLATPYLQAMGVSESSVQAYAGTDPETKRLRAEGRDMAGVLDESGGALVNMEQAGVTEAQATLMQASAAIFEELGTATKDLLDGANTAGDSIKQAADQLKNTKMSLELKPVVIKIPGLNNDTMRNSLAPFVNEMIKAALTGATAAGQQGQIQFPNAK